jgi:hypothetical protein
VHDFDAQRELDSWRYLLGCQLASAIRHTNLDRYVNICSCQCSSMIQRSPDPLSSRACISSLTNRLRAVFTMGSHSSRGFMSLPAEIRTMIYEDFFRGIRLVAVQRYCECFESSMDNNRLGLFLVRYSEHELVREALWKCAIVVFPQSKSLAAFVLNSAYLASKIQMIELPAYSQVPSTLARRALGRLVNLIEIRVVTRATVLVPEKNVSGWVHANTSSLDGCLDLLLRDTSTTIVRDLVHGEPLPVIGQGTQFSHGGSQGHKPVVKIEFKLEPAMSDPEILSSSWSFFFERPADSRRIQVVFHSSSWWITGIQNDKPFSVPQTPRAIAEQGASELVKVWNNHQRYEEDIRAASEACCLGFAFDHVSQYVVLHHAIERAARTCDPDSIWALAHMDWRRLQRKFCKFPNRVCFGGFIRRTRGGHRHAGALGGA